MFLTVIAFKIGQLMSFQYIGQPIASTPVMMSFADVVSGSRGVRVAQWLNLGRDKL